MKIDYREEMEKDAFENCKILYKQKNRPCTETCMCWGWEFRSGWNQIVRDLSFKLEALNVIFYPKYRVRVQADQAKEKYGTLHFYISTHIDSPWYLVALSNMFEKFHDKLKYGVDYKLEKIVDEPAKTTIDKFEFKSKEDYDEDYSVFGDCENVNYFDKDGKYWKETEVRHWEKYHMSPTKHKFLFILHKIMWKLRNYTDFSCFFKASRKQKIIANFVELISEKYVAEATDKCYNVCEECGIEIGTEWSPRIETEGWISYICDKCDVKRKMQMLLSDINFRIKNEKFALEESELNIVKDAENMMKTDTYVEKEEYEKYLKKIEELVKKN